MKDIQKVENVQEEPLDTVVLYVDTTQVDEAMEKVSQLKNLLVEVKEIIDSLQVNSPIDIQEIAKGLQILSIRNSDQII